MHEYVSQPAGQHEPASEPEPEPDEPEPDEPEPDEPEPDEPEPDEPAPSMEPSAFSPMGTNALAVHPAAFRTSVPTAVQANVESEAKARVMASSWLRRGGPAAHSVEWVLKGGVSRRDGIRHGFGESHVARTRAARGERG